MGGEGEDALGEVYLWHLIILTLSNIDIKHPSWNMIISLFLRVQRDGVLCELLILFAMTFQV